MVVYTYPNRTEARKGRRLETTWAEFVKELRRVRVTAETAAEYAAMSDSEKGEAKDRGGFVGGEVRDGHRLDENVVNRWVVTIDVDEAKTDDWETYEMLFDQTFNVCAHPTHSYTDAAPRLRWIFPLSRAVTKEEYIIVATVLAKWVDYSGGVDECTAEPARLMYWPSLPRDLAPRYDELFHAVTDGVDIDPDEVLASGEGKRAAENPLRRKGATGARGGRGSGTGAGKRSRAHAQLTTVPDVIPLGERNNTLFSHAGAARKAGFGAEEIRAVLAEINERRCEIPVDDAEIDHLVASVMCYEPGSSALVPIVHRAMDDFADLGLSVECQPEELMDLGQAMGLGTAMVARALRTGVGDQVRYCPGLGALLWTGTHYEENEAGVKCLLLDWVERAREALGRERWAAVHDTEKARNFGDEAKAEAAESRAEKIAAVWGYLGKYLNRDSREAAFKDWMMMISEKESAFDADPYLLNTPDGVVDLRTGQIRLGRYEDRCTRVTLCGPGERGEAMWREFLSSVTGGDKELEKYMQLMFGLAAVGEIKEEGMYIILGEGGRGKSTMVNAIREVMGGYSGGIQNQTLLSDRQGNTGADKATLQGLRLVIASELEENSVLSSSQVKAITSTDPIRAEPKYMKPFDFIPSHTVVLFSNFLPKVNSTDWGTWRRLKVIPFDVPQGGTRNYGKDLAVEAGPAIMKWIVEGAVEMARRRYEMPTCAVVEAKTAKYRETENPVPRFIEDCCVVEEKGRISRGSLVKAYNRWCDDMRETKVSAQRMAREMERLGFETKVVRGTRFWAGLRLREWADDLRDEGAEDAESDE